MDALGAEFQAPQKCERILYWSQPIFLKDGHIDVNALKNHLISEVPNNLQNQERVNLWEPGKEFQVYIKSQDMKHTIIYKCVLTVDSGGVVKCTLCRKVRITPLIKGIRKRIAKTLTTQHLE